MIGAPWSSWIFTRKKVRIVTCWSCRSHVDLAFVSSGFPGESTEGSVSWSCVETVEIWESTSRILGCTCWIWREKNAALTGKKLHSIFFGVDTVKRTRSHHHRMEDHHRIKKCLNFGDFSQMLDFHFFWWSILKLPWAISKCSIKKMEIQHLLHHQQHTTHDQLCTLYQFYKQTCTNTPFRKWNFNIFTYHLFSQLEIQHLFHNTPCYYEEIRKFNWFLKSMNINIWSLNGIGFEKPTRIFWLGSERTSHSSCRWLVLDEMQR